MTKTSFIFSKKTYVLLFFFGLAGIAMMFTNACSSGDNKKNKSITQDSLLYLNHSDSAKYVGMNTCRQCHQSIYNTFIETGMGKSFDHATRQKSSGNFSKAEIYDRFSDLHYRAFWDHDSLFFKEFRLEGRDTVFQRTEQVNYIIGSGQHTNSHMYSVNGYVYQMPMTFYTQKKKWDLPPGFENGVNTRFSRKIGLECMSCHNGYPDFVLGSENKFEHLPTGIDCERCHGPGSIHVEQRQTGSRIDTSKYIDYSIVNPAKLSIDAQFDICQRCHLQGNAILKEGRSFFDFKPGQKLSEYISVFLPKYKNADDEFIMASHADRLKQSPCFIKSYERVKNKSALKPYKEAMTCVTCHNPHVSVKQTNKDVFNDACLNCHNQSSAGSQQFAVGANQSTLQIAHSKLPTDNWKNCVSCHMPASGSTDIPHVSVHDHYIRKPISTNEKEKIKEFVGLFSVNEKNPDKITKARAYLDQYEKFEQNPVYLDSTVYFLDQVKDLQKKAGTLIKLYFIKQQYDKIIATVQQLGPKKAYDSVFTRKSYDNAHAWSAYQVAEAYSGENYPREALKWFQRACDLAPYNLDFRSKLASTLVNMKDLQKASEQYEFIIKENPKFVSAYSNLGYIKLVTGFPAEAIRLYTIGGKLDPDNEALLLNLAGYYIYMKDKSMARKQLEHVLKRNPTNQRAKMVLDQLKTI
ncbi:MAG: pilus assembly protein TadD [Bacteroidia bacterium]|nr:pilus assembly protein TadD [Bacteroidia bacterium]